MLVAPGTTSWSDAGLLLAGLLVAGFLVSWVLADVLHCARHLYIAALAAVTLAAWVVVARVTGASLSDMLGHRWGAGLAGALLTGLVTGGTMRRVAPATHHPLSRQELPRAAAWEGIVYGIAEGVLLSVLPVFVGWQAAADAGWADPSTWAVALAFSVAMIVVHHMGYWDYRNREVLLVVVGCGVLSLGYLATGSLLAPAIGHVIMHVTGITGGVELPPHARPGPVALA